MVVQNQFAAAFTPGFGEASLTFELKLFFLINEHFYDSSLWCGNTAASVKQTQEALAFLCKKEDLRPHLRQKNASKW